jgi:YbgC/YbaW family acyl-CoA thioester hydrolase
LVTRIPYRIELRDLDGFQHLGHARVVELLELVRTRAYNEPLGITELADHDLIMVELNVRYHAQGYFGDELILAGRVSAIGTTSLAFDYEIGRADGQTLVTARSYNVCFDHASNAPRPVAPPLRAACARAGTERPHPRDLSALPDPGSLAGVAEPDWSTHSRGEVVR